MEKKYQSYPRERIFEERFTLIKVGQGNVQNGPRFRNALCNFFFNSCLGLRDESEIEKMRCSIFKGSFVPIIQGIRSDKKFLLVPRNGGARLVIA